MIKTIILSLSFLFVTPCLLADTGDIYYENHVYNPNIRSVLLYPAMDRAGTNMMPAAIHIGQQQPLILKFDEINTEEAERYQCKIMHMNASWNPSSLTDMEFLYAYNEFNIEDYEFSINTRTMYTHFTFVLPKVKITGNYLLVVYREDDNEVIITQRFIVFDQQIDIMAANNMSTGVSERFTNHQIDFKLNYQNIRLSNPYSDIKVVIRQNHRWDNMITIDKPTTVNNSTSEIIYRFFDFENNFKAGNEFRFFDLRSERYGGQNVQHHLIERDRIDAYLNIDLPRATAPYTFTHDFNGAYYVEKKEGINHHVEADYVYTHFNLEIPESLEDIYIAGKLTDWQYGQNNKMNFNKTENSYEGTILLKQGFYNFIYYSPEAKNPYWIEGSFRETSNEYEIIVYLSHPSMRADAIIGYLLIK